MLMKKEGGARIEICSESITQGIVEKKEKETGKERSLRKTYMPVKKNWTNCSAKSREFA